MRMDFKLPRVIAHRGESGLAPENTLAAFSLAADNGATWVELDANISADRVPYVHHDNVVDRCTNGSGKLCDLNSDYLATLDAGAWFDKRFTDEPLPSLQAVIELLTERGMGLNLEIKPTAGLEEPTTDAICATVAQHWPSSQPLVFSSFSEQAIRQTKLRMPDAICGYLVGAVPKDWSERMRSLACDTLHCAANHLDADTAAAIKEAGYGLLCYTVNDASMAEQLWSWGVDSVITDFPSQLIDTKFA